MKFEDYNFGEMFNYNSINKKEFNNIKCIYSLWLDNKITYIGRTTNLRNRLYQHWYKKEKTIKKEWKGDFKILKLFDKILDQNELHFWELYYMWFFKWKTFQYIENEESIDNWFKKSLRQHRRKNEKNRIVHILKSFEKTILFLNSKEDKNRVYRWNFTYNVLCFNDNMKIENLNKNFSLKKINEISFWENNKRKNNDFNFILDYESFKIKKEFIDKKIYFIMDFFLQKFNWYEV
ncbi:MAG: hypothetical protein HPPSJP_4370 [Candidatus Hepatoplasma scabrum]|nr:MAG: hypothetical protein HPPSJP_4370 [Candidatus Hepatoplasma sp.]